MQDSMGIGNMLPELALDKACNSCAAAELMERRKKEGSKRDECMETQTKKPKSIDLQIKTHIHTRSVKSRNLNMPLIRQSSSTAV